MGDFNLDWSTKNKPYYAFKNYFKDFNEVLGGLNLVQVVNFSTWSRTVNYIHKESVLDHVNLINPTNITLMYSVKPTFGDHIMIILEHMGHKPSELISIHRSWLKYKKESLTQSIAAVDWQIKSDAVQDYWNQFEHMLVGVVDELVPLCEFINNTYIASKIPSNIKNKTNKRKRLLKT
jgi:hypothetical protein